MGSLLETNKDPLSYKRVDFSKYKDSTPPPFKFKKGEPYERGHNNATDVSKLPAGTLLGAFKKGGMVKKTGNYKLHEGEKVVPKNKVEKKKRELATKCK